MSSSVAWVNNGGVVLYDNNTQTPDSSPTPQAIIYPVIHQASSFIHHIPCCQAGPFIHHIPCCQAGPFIHHTPCCQAGPFMHHKYPAVRLDHLYTTHTLLSGWTIYAPHTPCCQAGMGRDGRGGLVNSDHIVIEWFCRSVVYSRERLGV